MRSNRRRLSLGVLSAFAFSSFQHHYAQSLALASPSSVHVILPGFAQSQALYQSHANALQRSLAAQHDVEASAPGVQVFDYSANLPDGSVTLGALSHQLVASVRDRHPDVSKLHLIGFSLGARLALATAVEYPELVASLSLTGVGLHRTERALVTMQAWRHLLQAGNKEGFAWTALLASYSPEHLKRHSESLQEWVQGMVQVEDSPLSDIDGLLRLLEATVDSGEYSVAKMAAQCCRSPPPVRLAVGSQDTLVNVDQVRKLANALIGNEDEKGGNIAVFPHAGHAVPLEAHRTWQKWIIENCS